MTHSTRNTSTGLNYEKLAVINANGEDISKRKLKDFLFRHNVKNPLNYLSWMFQPDEAYYFEDTNEVIIYEKKYQQVSGSADEKLGACAWKIKEYKDVFEAAGINKVSYIFIFCDWFKQKRYEKLLKYIKSVDGCDYMFIN